MRPPARRETRLPHAFGEFANRIRYYRNPQEHDLGVRFKPPKPRKRQARSKPKSLESDERKALLRAVEGRGKTRDILLIRCGLDGGLRVSEMAGLKWSRVEVSERKGRMTIDGKGGKERIVDLIPALRNAFLEHGYEQYKDKDLPVFEGQRGGLSIRGVQDIIERYGKITKVGKAVGLKGFSAHSLRHTAADWLLNEKGLTVPEVAEVLGHSDIKTTMIYARPQKGRLSDRMSKIDD